MMRVIGNFDRKSPKNNRVKAFLDWMQQFEGCLFYSDDGWKRFKEKVHNRLIYSNSCIKENGYRIEVSIHKNQISVTCGNGNRGEWFSQLFITVIPVKSYFDIESDDIVEEDDYDDQG